MAFEQKILLVDDVPENIFSLESILEEEGRVFPKANSGEEALKILLKEDDIDLILLDVQMPGMDGFETAKLIRGAKRTRNIPIIFVTAISKEQKNIFKGYEAGAVDYMFKPLDPGIVKCKVKIFLELAAQRRQLQKQNQALVTAKRNTDLIFENVDQGIFLVNNNFRIKPQYSSSLAEMLCENNLTDKDLLSIFKNGLDENVSSSGIDYLRLMFEEGVDENELDQLNPLQTVRIHNSVKKREKYLTFKFKRIIINEKLEELIATVSDNTQQVLLQSQLDKAQEQSSRNLELVKILDVEPALVKEFLQQTENELKQARDLVKSKSRDPETIETIYRAIHSIKGNASLLGLNFISEKSHQIEEIVLGMNENVEILDSHKEEVLGAVGDLFKILNEIHILIDKMKYFHQNYEGKSGYEGQILLKAMEDLLERLEKEYGHKIDFNYLEFDVSLVPEGGLLIMKDVLIQLFRNAVIHSYQTPEERKKLGKPLDVTLTLTSKKQDDYLLITLEDDGKGLQYDIIKKKAVQAKKVKASQADKMNDGQLAELIFESGISTAEKIDLTAGRGIGMGIIKSKIEEMSGKIEVESVERKYCRFNIYLPLSKNTEK